MGRIAVVYSQQKFFQVWRLGRQLVVNQIEQISVDPQGYPTEVAVLLERNLANVAFTNDAALPQYETAPGPWLSRKGEDGKWQSIQIRMAESERTGRYFHFPFLPQGAGYVHLVSTENSPGAKAAKIILLTISTGDFAELATNSNKSWQQSVIRSGWNETEGISSIIVPDSSTGKHRLYFFGRGRDNEGTHALVFSWISLRQDCSVESSASQFNASSKTIIPLPCEAQRDPPRLVLWQNKVMVLVDSDKFLVCTGQIGPDGSLPAGKDWKITEAQFNTPPLSRGDASFGGATLVPDDFV